MLIENEHKIFDRDSCLVDEPNSALYKLREKFSTYGLSANQFMIYVFLGKRGSKTAIEISKTLKLPRTKTYYLLKTLMNTGIVTANFEHPIMFSAMSPDEAFLFLLNTEKEKISMLEDQKNDVLTLWNALPDFQSLQSNDAQDKFQILKGAHVIHTNIRKMITTTQEEFQVLGSEKSFLQFYHADIFNLLGTSNLDMKFLTPSSNRSVFMFNEINITKVRKIPPEIKEELCFTIKDNTELLYFIRNVSTRSAKDQVAIWTDSPVMINSMKLLFRCLWSQSYSLVNSCNALMKH
ncbi:MAG: TrmB family transcriptional regulator [Thaumarchaeota archaeon]|nr:TrmB family transcriptional regulator [Nitrososphaerota archaeon]MBI3642104.1 TrmB family transcriptional regulator [Nitrososphaerota archaeon]